MKKLILAVGVLLLFVSTVSAEWVNGYTRRDGTYVQGYQRSSPDSTRTNNYGPSTNYYDKTNPYSRDSDKDGIPNYRDRDDNNDGKSDDYKKRGY
jgi:hypothetical protein